MGRWDWIWPAVFRSRHRRAAAVGHEKGRNLEVWCPELGHFQLVFYLPKLQDLEPQIGQFGMTIQFREVRKEMIYYDLLVIWFQRRMAFYPHYSQSMSIPSPTGQKKGPLRWDDHLVGWSHSARAWGAHPSDGSDGYLRPSAAHVDV